MPGGIGSDELSKPGSVKTYSRRGAIPYTVQGAPFVQRVIDEGLAGYVVEFMLDSPLL
jgi:hypothetical protein